MKVSWPFLRGIALNFVPLTAAAVFFWRNRVHGPAVASYLEILLGLGCLWFCRGKSLRPSIVMIAFLGLLTSYLVLSYDLILFAQRLAIYLIAVVLAFGIGRTRAKQPILMPVFLLLALLLDSGLNLAALKSLWNVKVGPQERGQTHQTGLVYPFGMYSPVFSTQGMRYPELIGRHFNFFGNRSAWREYSQFPYEIWTVFIMTKSFSQFYKSPWLIDESIRDIQKGFAQGWTLEDPEHLGYRLKPKEANPEFFEVTEVSGQEMRIKIVSKAKNMVLPLLANPSLNVRTSELGTVSVNSAGFLYFTPAQKISEVRVTVSRVWVWIVLLFWLPALVLASWAAAARLIYRPAVNALSRDFL